MKSKFLTIGGLSALSVTIIANFGFADVSSDRLDTYKANKLIPNEVQIATINSVSSDSAGVAVFSPDVLSWKSYSNAASAALGKYMDWTREDFEAFFADSANEAEFEDAWNALSQFGNGHVQGAAISDEDAMAVLQDEFNALIDQFNQAYVPFPAFPCEGISFDGLSLHYIDLRDCTGITGQQLASTDALYYCTIKPVDFSGADLSNSYFLGINLSNCTGITADQLSSMSGFSECILPAVDLSTADFSGKNLSGVDFSKCTGLTGTQLAASSGFSACTLPDVDFTGADLSGKDLSEVDLSKCTNLTAEQLLSASSLSSAKLPSVDFTGADLSGRLLSGIDFSKCTNLTAAQLLSANDFNQAKLPSVDFTGANLAGKYLYGVDFTQCTGLTGTQLAAASTISSIYLTQAQYDAMKADLPSGTRIYVNGKSTRIP